MPPLAELMRSESLERLLDPGQLKALRASFTAATGLTPIYRDANGEVLESLDEELATEAKVAALAASRDGDASSFHVASIPAEIDEALRSERADPAEPIEVPIVIDGVTVGSIGLESPTHAGRGPLVNGEAGKRLRANLEAMDLADHQVESLLDAVDQACDCSRTAAGQLLTIFAHGVANLCAQQMRGRQSSRELDALYELSTLLTRHRDVQQVLDAAAKAAAQVMRVKAASIRLLSSDSLHLIVRAVHNLSIRYVRKGPVAVHESEINRRALAGEIVQVKDMATDPRVIYPQSAQTEGLASILCAGLRFRDRPIGVIRIYTERPRPFSRSDRNLLGAIAHIVATAIENARLDAEYVESQQIQRQLQVAAAVQRRLMPGKLPSIPKFEFASRYEPSLDLSGDFYDVIDLDGHLGLSVGDVVGKGIAASLLMASVRSSLRAYSQDVYDLDEILRRVNVQLTRDTLDQEFATLFYGVLNPDAMKFTYCNAGHEPALLMRNGGCRRLLRGGMVLGVDPTQRYAREVVDLRPGDTLMLFTDGLTEAQNFDGKPFGRTNIAKAMRETAGGTAQETLNHVFWEMRRFTGLNRNLDDTTMLVVKATKDD